MGEPVPCVRLFVLMETVGGLGVAAAPYRAEETPRGASLVKKGNESLDSLFLEIFPISSLCS